MLKDGRWNGISGYPNLLLFTLGSELKGRRKGENCLQISVIVGSGHKHACKRVERHFVGVSILESFSSRGKLGKDRVELIILVLLIRETRSHSLISGGFGEVLRKIYKY